MAVEGKIYGELKDRTGKYNLHDLALLGAALDYFIDVLHTSNHGFAEVEVNLVDDIECELGADCHRYGEMYEREPSSQARLFVIDLECKTSFIELLRTLAHEMIHVIQSYEGRLTIIDGDWKWKGKSYGRHPYRNNKLDMKLPWEMQATKYDSKLAKDFIAVVYSLPQH